ncbi:SPOR domain-containing protein [Roseovarius sp.]|uniref:SPOR domain-containing protein n=1 Tax=Roseovarius sp. TaxID=1486281 RepID=UPI0026157E11|nr:SPOR domain-containing protein [Roseovarius sp.]
MFIQSGGKRSRWRGLAMAGIGLVFLAGCDETGGFNPFQAKPEQAAQGASPSSSVKLVERDVEAPDVFQVTDMGLWDGRPSLGGVWVAHPDVKEPERVIIRNTDNSKFVIGALFRRERENPGPALQVSSDAANALGMLAGAPVQLNVTALRREETPEAAPAAEEAPIEELAAPGEIGATSLDPIAGAAAAIDAAEAQAASDEAKPEAAAAAPKAAPAPAPAPRATSLEKPFIQIGIFSIEQNASNTATAMRQAGMLPTVIEQTSQGKTFWRVIVGPATNSSERGVLLKKIKGIGFDDAYPVTN